MLCGVSNQAVFPNTSGDFFQPWHVSLKAVRMLEAGLDSEGGRGECSEGNAGALGAHNSAIIQKHLLGLRPSRSPGW